MWLRTGSIEKLSSQDEVIYQLKQKVEELRSENEKLRHENLMIKTEGTFDIINLAQLFISYNNIVINS